MDNIEILDFCLQGIKDKGMDKGECTYCIDEKYEFNFSLDSIALLRTTKNSYVKLKAIKDNKESSITINDLDSKNINEKTDELLDMCNASKEDEFNDIAPFSENEEFKQGDTLPDLDKMHNLITNFVEYIKTNYKEIVLFDDSILFFNKKIKYIKNTNNVYLKSDTSSYVLDVTYLAKNNETSTSFNGFECIFDKLPESIMEYKFIEKKFSDAIKELNSFELKDKFLGDVILTPELSDEFTMYFNELFLSDNPMIARTSILKDKLNKKVADDKLTILCEPIGDEMSNKVFITSDGMKTYNFPIIENGILKTFLLSLYGSRKTKEKFAPYIDNIRILNGNTKLQDIIKSTKKGIILGRFSGGNPAQNGEFSGIAKNSYYIENGEIKYAIKEAMISGNVYELFNNIESISEETIKTGYMVTPWIKINNITISGK